MVNYPLVTLMQDRIDTGRRIRRRRIGLRWDIPKMAHKTGFTESWIKDAENGKQKIARWQAKKIAKVMGGDWEGYYCD